MELGFSNVELEGDLAILINSLKDDHRSLAQFGHIVADIHYLASHFSFFKLSHVHRHCNKVVDSLVRRVITPPSPLSLSVWMEDVPPDITHVLLADLSSPP